MRWPAVSPTQVLRRSKFCAAGVPHPRSGDNLGGPPQECDGQIAATPPSPEAGYGTTVPCHRKDFASDTFSQNECGAYSGQECGPHWQPHALSVTRHPGARAGGRGGGERQHSTRRSRRSDPRFASRSRGDYFLIRLRPIITRPRTPDVGRAALAFEAAEEVHGNFSLKRHLGLSAIRLESGRMQKRRGRQPLNERALGSLSKAIAARLLVEWPELRPSLEMEQAREPDGLSIVLDLQSPTGDPARCLELWVEGRAEGPDLSVGFGPWHTHASVASNHESCNRTEAISYFSAPSLATNSSSSKNLGASTQDIVTPSICANLTRSPALSPNGGRPIESW